MWVTPFWTASRRTARAWSRSRGGPKTPGPASCMAPKPMRLRTRSSASLRTPPGALSAMSISPSPTLWLYLHPSAHAYPTATLQLLWRRIPGMAWDTEGTRRRLKEAATAEFAEHGPDGTTMARIAERAGINKERLYKYFGDKQALFETVLTDELDKLAASVAPVPAGFEEIGEFAGRTFDYQAAHPQLV